MCSHPSSIIGNLIHEPGKYFPMLAAGDMPNGTIFPFADGGSSATEACDATYNLSTPSAEQLRTKYHYTHADLRNSTRIIWSLGQYDPTSGVSPNQLGINAPNLSADRNVSRVLYTSDMAHREDLFSPDPSDRETVIQVSGFVLFDCRAELLIAYRRDKLSLNLLKDGWGLIEGWHLAEDCRPCEDEGEKSSWNDQVQEIVSQIEIAGIVVCF